MVEVNDLLLLNETIYRIHTDVDFDAMRKFVLESLLTLLNCDGASFFIIERLNNERLGRPISINCPKIEEYFDFYKKIDYGVGLFQTGRSIVYRESDIMSDEKRVKTEYYNRVYRDNAYHHSIHLILAFNSTFIGVVSFYRKKEKENFERKDTLYLELIKEHLNHRVYSELIAESSGRYSLDEMIKIFGLTSKEAMVLECLLDGKDNNEISTYIGVAHNTLKKHLNNIYQKTKCNGKIALLQRIKK